MTDEITVHQHFVMNKCLWRGEAGDSAVAPLIHGPAVFL